MPLKLLSLNIEGDNHFEPILRLVEREQPDVVCFQEVFEADLPFLQTSLHMQAQYVPTGLVTQPNNVRLSPKGKIGVAVFTRTLPQATSNAYYSGDPSSLGELNMRNPEVAPHAILRIDAVKDESLYRIITTHFTWAAGGGVNETQRRDLQQLFNVLEPFNEYVLCGDFNAPRGKEIFNLLATHYKDNIPPEVTTTMDNALHRNPHLLPLVVDGLFTTPKYMAADVQVIAGVSDHRAIIANITPVI